jgi:hypothetical protein
MVTRSAIVFAFVLAVAGCSGAPIQTYPGPQRLEGELAVLGSSSNAMILSVDGIRASGLSPTWSLLPGPHDVLMKVRVFTSSPNQNWKVWSYCWVELEAVAGEAYTSRVRVTKQVEPGLADRVKIEVGIADHQDRLQAVPNRCSGKRPPLEG